MSEYPTNSQIVDSVTDVTAQVLGSSALLSNGILDNIMAHSTGLMMNQAVANQQSARTSNQAAVTSACAKMLSNPGQPQAPPSEPRTRPVSPLANPSDSEQSISVSYSQAQSAISSLNQDLIQAENNRQNAQDHLRSLGNLAKSDF